MSTFPLPDISLDGRVIIMTGGDRGLGRSMALAQARSGAKLVIASVDADGCRRVAAEIDEIAGRGHALAATTDITELDQCRRLVAQTLETFGRLDVLFNNARRLMRGPGLPPAGRQANSSKTARRGASGRRRHPNAPCACTHSRRAD